VTAIFALTFALSAQAQTYQVIHYFTGADGTYPEDLTVDQAGNLYGAALSGGSGKAGVIYRMTKYDSGWTFVPLYNFKSPSSGNDGASPWGVVIGPGGKLYGTTDGGGDSQNCFGGCGTVFSISPPTSICGSVSCPWTETQLHVFTGGPDDGAAPGNAELVFDQQGNIYGTTVIGGSGSCTFGCGAVYELSHGNGGWSSSVLYSFQEQSPDDNFPYGGVIFGPGGSLYGTALAGGLNNAGTIYELTPNNDGTWSKSTLVSFDYGGFFLGTQPYGSLLLDPHGAMYGTNSAGGSGQNGTAFELNPANLSQYFSLLYNFNAPIGDTGQGPEASLTEDATGNLYGTTVGGGEFGYGNVFKLSFTNGSWTYTSLHDFDGVDGRAPRSRVVIDAQGNLYGTTQIGGPENPACGPDSCGVVWEITP
jgi:uncharacterized repeat protein (TIGR03803 family)